MVLSFYSALEKLFPAPLPPAAPFALSGFENETISFQAAFRAEKTPWGRQEVTIDILSPIAHAVTVRQVKNVPVSMACYPGSDDGYLFRGACMAPDLLLPIAPHTLFARQDTPTILWLDVDAAKAAPGTHPVTLRVLGEDGATLCDGTQNVTILPGKLPEQTLECTRWMHYDCIAQHYGVRVFSAEFWRITENFIRRAVKSGVNMILVPTHTPPLDTREGSERLTVQLVGVTLQNGQYRFDMENLRRFIALCKRCGVEFYEIAHLFTQWGAKHAPKIIANVDGCEKRIFGWETDAAGSEYRAFLEAYIPALRSVFDEEGIAGRIRWHISDEPHLPQLPSYRAAKAQVSDLLDGQYVTDALSSYEFYAQGVIAHPIVANDAIAPFLEHSVPNLWTYYCCAQHKDVSNAFIALPSARTRVLAAQLFKYDIKGFLHWGFNFYSSQFSDYPIDPFATTDADGWVPAGDPFLVYPGEGGEPLDSLRLMVLTHAMQDLRAMNLLASLTSRGHVVTLIEKELAAPLTFSRYPADASWLLDLRERINREIAVRLNA
ncbi:MAG: DUF4091 domain-containing protein [Clostridia bacterium]|nr:DUF4091 domain-containing protein [Clostridia bacterium]